MSVNPLLPNKQHGVNYCEGCEGLSGLPPVTKKGFCRVCAATACERGYGEQVGLPTNFDLGKAIQALGMHMHECLGPTSGCKICPFGSSTCSECTYDFLSAEFHNNTWPHLMMGTFILIACEGYYAPILRQAAAELL